MPKHVIFLLHGMGDTRPGWSQSLQTLIKQKYQLYKISSIKKFDQQFEFSELNYNQFFTRHIERWQEKASAITTVLEASGIPSDLLARLLGYTSKTARKDFASTHVLDFILYRFMKGLKSQIIAHLSEQLVGRLNESASVPSYSVICHSLGTAVMHDVMQANLTTPHFPLSTAHGVPEVYMSVANVSRILQDSDSDVYRSAVRPRLSGNQRPYGCNQFINLAHSLDPFTRVKTFKPDWKKGANNPLNSLKYESYQSVGIAGLTGVNPHDFEHYLDNPDAHVPLFRALMSKRVIKDSELKTQRDAYHQRTFDGQLNTVKSAIKNIDVGAEFSLDKALAAWTEYQQLIQLQTILLDA